MRELATNTDEVERLKFENKIMKLELQRMRYEESSMAIPEAENQSFTGSLSQLDQNGYEVNSMIRYGGPRSEIEKPIESEMSLKWPLCNSYPPCAHYSSDSGYNLTGSVKQSEIGSKRISGQLFQK